jgi:hypothetical protein
MKYIVLGVFDVVLYLIKIRAKNYAFRNFINFLRDIIWDRTINLGAVLTDNIVIHIFMTSKIKIALHRSSNFIDRFLKYFERKQLQL